MDITILIEREGIRAQASVQSLGATRIPGVHRIQWYGARTKSHHGYFSLVHIYTGRALNKVPLTMDESDRLIDLLIEDGTVEWNWIVDGKSGIQYYADRLSPEAESLAGRY